MNEEKRLNENGKRMVAWNGHVSDDHRGGIE
jgi:hypothetical protein